MRRSCRSSLALGVLLISCFTGCAARRPIQDLAPAVTVRRYEYAKVPPADLADMEAEVIRILGEAGIPCAWLSCRAASTQQPEHPDCEQPRTPTSLLLRIVEGDPATRKLLGFTALGFSVVTERGGFLSTVIMSRVEQLSREGAATQGKILGHAAAHELGHLLLHSNAHSLAGIMQVHWDQEDLRKMAAGSLLFTAQESALMRENVMRRSRR